MSHQWHSTHSGLIPVCCHVHRNTFFVGLTMFKHMPRQTFGRVQAQLFPKCVCSSPPPFCRLIRLVDGCV